MLTQRWTRSATIAFCFTVIPVSQYAQAEESNEPAANSPSSDDPLPKGFDDSFKSGDLPKPVSPELDPDLVEDDNNPETKSTAAAIDEVQRDRIQDNILFGFTAGLTFPHLINLGLDSIIDKKFGVSVNYGNVTRSLDNVDVALRHTDVRLRWFPWQSSFFAGLGFGQHRLVGELDRTVKDATTKASIATHGKLIATANYVLPHVGWFAVWDSGFTLGCDFGYLVPSAAKSTFTSSFTNAPTGTEDALKDSTEYKKMKSDLEASAKKYASKSVPFATFMRFGWMF